MTPELWDAVRLSVVVATLATLGTAPVAIALGLWLARLTGPARVALEVVVTAPLVLPPVVTGYALLWALGRQGPLGAVLYDVFGARVVFHTAGAVLAAAVMALPLFVRAVRLGAEAVDPGLVEAARTLGASRWRALVTITLPLALPGIAAGAALAFGRALGEFGATITFAGNIAGETRTVPLALFTALQTPGGQDAAGTLAWVALALSVGAVLASEGLSRWAARRVGR